MHGFHFHEVSHAGIFWLLEDLSWVLSVVLLDFIIADTLQLHILFLSGRYGFFVHYYLRLDFW